MSDVTCTVEETASATARLVGGLTNVIVNSALALSVGLLGVTLIVDEAAASTELIEESISRMVTEQANAASVATSQLNTSPTVTERGTARSEAVSLPSATAVSTGIASDELYPSTTTVLIERIGATDEITSARITTVVVAERAVASSAPLGVNDILVDESAAAGGVATPSAAATATVAEQAAAVSSATQDALVSVAVIERGGSASTAPTQLTATATVAETARGVDEALFPVLRAAWVTNSATMAMSRYADLPVASIARIGGNVLALGEEGLYRFDGDDDDGVPISASIKTGRMLLGSQMLKRLSDIVVGYTCAGVMTVRVSTYGGSPEGTYSYDMPPRRADAPRGNRLTVGKGLRSRYWQFEFLNKDGAAMHIDTMVADVATSDTRRF